jgi:transcriptional regulator with GAF, ATPase, and Fis domain
MRKLLGPYLISGKFELAHNGTFLGRRFLPLHSASYLCVQEESGKVEMLGFRRCFRLISVNADLKALVKEGKFRELLLRITSQHIYSPLRERGYHINYFLKTINDRFGTKFGIVLSSVLFHELCCEMSRTHKRS